MAVVDGKVIAAADDAYVAFKKAQEKYPNKKISIFSVRRKEDKYLLV